MIATLLALLKARWALMKTRRLAIAVEKGRVGAMRAQAWGLVSSMIVNRDGGGSDSHCQRANFFPLVRTMIRAYHRISCCSGRSHRHCP